MPAQPETTPVADRDAIRISARDTAPDHYLSALLAPRHARGDLVTLAAYFGEVARVAMTAGDAMIAEIRLQWWREALETGARSGHPVADAMTDLVAAHRLDIDDVLAPIAAADHLVATGSTGDETGLDAYIDATQRAHFRLSAHVTGGSAEANAGALVAAAGDAYGRARLAVDLPYYLIHGRMVLPPARFGGHDPRALLDSAAAEAVAAATAKLADEAKRSLDIARPQFSQAGRALRAAVLPVALVGPYLAGLQEPGRHVLRHPAAISPMTRAVGLWLARWRGKV